MNKTWRKRWAGLKESMGNIKNALEILYYIRNQLDATLAVLCINNCKITLHVSDVHCVHHQEYINCSSSHWCLSWVGKMYIQ